MGTRNRLGIGVSYRPARLRRLSELIHSVESISGFLKSLKIRAQEGEGRVKSISALKINIYGTWPTRFPIFKPADDLSV